MKFAEFLFVNKTHGDYFLHWYYECPCGKLFGEVKEKEDVTSNHPFYRLHQCGGWKAWAYHIFKPVFKLFVFIPFLVLWSVLTQTAVVTNLGFIIYSTVVGIPLYALYAKLFRKWRPA